MATKIPGGKPPEKIEPLLPPEAGIGSNDPAPGRQMQQGDADEGQVAQQQQGQGRPARRPVELRDTDIGKDNLRPKNLKGL